MLENELKDINDHHREQLLKLVSKSFYKEMKKYGVNVSDTIKLATNLLEHATNTKNDDIDTENGYYNKILKLNQVSDNWHHSQSLSYDPIRLSALLPEMIPQICMWLKDSVIQNTFISLFPRSEAILEEYLIKNPHRKYFAISHEEEFIGIIGADTICEASKSIEMKKFIGAPHLRGKGLGKFATFLFLYYVFKIMKFHKTYIFSMDTNIKNINLNSKFGFELEGIFFEEIQLDGSFKDVVRMGLLRSKWESIFKENG